jgi:hypothetical protein
VIPFYYYYLLIAVLILYFLNISYSTIRCNPNPDIASFYSMNVTGVPAAGVQSSGGGGQNKMASATAITNSLNTTATVPN